MRVLALDAAGVTCAAALLDGDRCLGERSGGNSRTATAALPPIVQELLAEHGGGFDAVAVTIGPGSFTGLRGALALAQGLALGAGMPVVGVRVSEALLHGVVHAGPVWVALDSRRPGRIFLDSGCGMTACMLEALPRPPSGVVVLGDGAELVRALLPGIVVGGAPSVSAASVGRVALQRLAGTIGPCDAQPLYIEAPAARA